MMKQASKKYVNEAYAAIVANIKKDPLYVKLDDLEDMLEKLKASYGPNDYGDPMGEDQRACLNTVSVIIDVVGRLPTYMEMP